MKTFCHSVTKRGSKYGEMMGLARHFGFVTELPKGEFVSSCVGLIQFQNADATVHGSNTDIECS